MNGGTPGSSAGHRAVSPGLFTLFTSDFQQNSGLCRVQKHSDNNVRVGCVTDGQEMVYKSLIEDRQVQPSAAKHLQDLRDGDGLPEEPASPAAHVHQGSLCGEGRDV